MVASTLAGAFGGILMKLSHVVLITSSEVQLTPEERRHRQRVSWAYFLVGAVACQAVLNVGLSAAALASAPQSLLSPFVSCQIVFNALLSPCLGEQLTRRDLIGTLLIVVGCTLAGVFAPHAEQHYKLHDLLEDFRHGPFLVYLFVMAVLVAGMYVGARAPALVVRRVCAPALPGAFVGNANLFGKGAAGLVEELFLHHSAAARKALSEPLAYLILAVAPLLALGSLFFLNRALAQFDASRVVPIYISTLIVTSTVRARTRAPRAHRARGRPAAHPHLAPPRPTSPRCPAWAPRQRRGALPRSSRADLRRHLL